jgi:hypothetical protein
LVGTSKPYILLLPYRSKGLGKNQQGITDVIQVKRREEGQGLGAEGIEAKSF